MKQVLHLFLYVVYQKIFPALMIYEVADSYRIVVE